MMSDGIACGMLISTTNDLAVVAMRFDTSDMGNNWTEICAYGTAVKAVRSA